MITRPVTQQDLDAVFAIYDHEVAHGTGTFDTQPSTPDQRIQWLEEHADPRHPAIAAVVDGRLAGWATLSSWSKRCAYARAAEVSVYVHHAHRRRGLGRALLRELIQRGRDAGLGVLLARITSEGAASLALHRAEGFQHIGTLRRVGEKFGRILDVELLDLHLDGG